MPPACLKPGTGGILLLVQAVPRSSRCEVVDFAGERCRIKVKAAPVDGEANAALVEFVAKVFGLPKRSVILQHGAGGKQKTLFLAGISLVEAEQRLTAGAGGRPSKERK